MTILIIRRNLSTQDFEVLDILRVEMFVMRYFLAAKKVTEVTGGLLLRVSMFDDFPLDVAPMIKLLNDLTTELGKIESHLIIGQYQEVVRAKNL